MKKYRVFLNTLIDGKQEIEVEAFDFSVSGPDDAEPDGILWFQLEDEAIIACFAPGNWIGFIEVK